MPRHRAPSALVRAARSRAAATLTITGAALGASVLWPIVATAAPAAGGPAGQWPELGGSARPGCDREVGPNELESALDQAQLHDVVCVPGGSHPHPGAQPRPLRHEVGAAYRHGPGSHRSRPAADPARHHRSGCHRGRGLDDHEQFSVPDLLLDTLGPAL
jgi:hypothetical protein